MQGSAWHNPPSFEQAQAVPDSTDPASENLHHKLLGETARISWPELERLFASGRLVRIGPELDLIAVGEAMAADDSARLKRWMQADQAGLLDDETARRWADNPDCELWALVISPWVLVQERGPHNQGERGAQGRRGTNSGIAD